MVTAPSTSGRSEDSGSGAVEESSPSSNWGKVTPVPSTILLNCIAIGQLESSKQKECSPRVIATVIPSGYFSVLTLSKALTVS